MARRAECTVRHCAAARPGEMTLECNALAPCELCTMRRSVVAEAAIVARACGFFASAYTAADEIEAKCGAPGAAAEAMHEVESALLDEVDRVLESVASAEWTGDPGSCVRNAIEAARSRLRRMK